MTKSMTAFARSADAEITWEIRSVNQRYLDTNFKVPDSFRGLEPELRNLLKGRVARGKLDCLLRIDTTGEDASFVVNEGRLRSLTAAMGQVAGIAADAHAPTTLDLLRWPGVLEEESINEDAMNQRVLAAFDEAVKNLVAMREREGAELERMIHEKLNEVAKIVETVRPEVATMQARQAQKVRDRIAEIGIEADPGRLEQELTFMAQKSDVAEELDRLETHIEEVRNALAEGTGSKPVGRRLDFLMQELNREANTLSSKAIASDTTLSAVELKVVIEQMREQVQNIE